MSIKNKLAKLLTIQLNSNTTTDPVKVNELKNEIKAIREDISKNGDEINKDNIHLYYYIMTIDDTLNYRDILATILVERFKTVTSALNLVKNIDGMYSKDEIKLYGTAIDSDKYEEIEFIQDSLLLEYSVFEIHDNLCPLKEYIQKCKNAMMKKVKDEQSKRLKRLNGLIFSSKKTRGLNILDYAINEEETYILVRKRKANFYIIKSHEKEQYSVLMRFNQEQYYNAQREFKNINLYC